MWLAVLLQRRRHRIRVDKVPIVQNAVRTDKTCQLCGFTLVSVADWHERQFFKPFDLEQRRSHDEHDHH